MRGGERHTCFGNGPMLRVVYDALELSEVRGKGRDRRDEAEKHKGEDLEGNRSHGAPVSCKDTCSGVLRRTPMSHVVRERFMREMEGRAEDSRRRQTSMPDARLK